MFNKLFYDDMEGLNIKRIKVIGLLILITIIILIVGNILVNPLKKETIKMQLNGEETITIKQYENYNELGVIATSSKDGDLSTYISINGSVNTSIVGTYTLTYKLMGEYDQDYTLTRTINVTANNPTDSTIATHTISNSIYTKDVININLSIILKNYRYTLLPNNTKNFSKNITYSVTTNGKYTFNVYDTNNTAHKYEVLVYNIDKTEPFASCSAITLNNETIITVSASDSGSGIMGYSYSLTSSYTDYITVNKYTFSGTAKTAYVRVKDNAGNIKNISCSVTNGGNTTPYKPPFINDNNKPLLTCTTYSQSDWQNLENQLVKAVDAAGRGTRAGVVAAARFLAGLPYRIAYQGARKDQDIGQYYHLGLHSNPTSGWGCRNNGLDCTGYVTWALINGGVDIGKMWVGSDYGPRHYLLDVANQVRVGDFAFQKSKTPGENFSHIGIVIGVDANNIYVAEERGAGMQISTVSKTEKHYVFTYVALADIYPSDGNITNMW